MLHSSTSEVVGGSTLEFQTEDEIQTPKSPYGVAKAAAEHMIKVYRDSYDFFVCFTRSFNFESKRRGEEFVTRKITKSIGDMWKILDKKSDEVEKIIAVELDGKIPNFIPTYVAFNVGMEQGWIQPIHLGNLEPKRDWSHAKDTANGMWLALQQDKPDDYVLSSGKTRSIREFLDEAFSVVGIQDWSEYVVQDPAFYRPADVHYLCGDNSKAKEKLGWEQQYTFEQLVEEMVKHDMGMDDEE